tara:strand:+ start:750 stop:989 length:240 start_codon:yes stop_codon:yes gene_type:complete
MILIKLRKVKIMKLETNSVAKDVAFNDMLKDTASRVAEHRAMKSNLQDALNTAEIHRLVFGDDFVDNNETIKTIIKERY